MHSMQNKDGPERDRPAAVGTSGSGALQHGDWRQPRMCSGGKAVHKIAVLTGGQGRYGAIYTSEIFARGIEIDRHSQDGG